jgi:CDGSH-type Zn-finger protein
MREVTPQLKPKDWRCPNCGRLLGKYLNEDYIEVRTENHQTVFIERKHAKAVCKCGHFINET